MAAGLCQSAALVPNDLFRGRTLEQGLGPPRGLGCSQDMRSHPLLQFFIRSRDGSVAGGKCALGERIIALRAGAADLRGGRGLARALLDSDTDGHGMVASP